MAKPNFQPFGANVLVKPLDEEKASSSGIVLPETVDKEKPEKGEVIALGTGKLNDKGENIPFRIKVGDVISFKKYSPEEQEVEGKIYLLITEDQILGTFTK